MEGDGKGHCTKVTFQAGRNTAFFLYSGAMQSAAVCQMEVQKCSFIRIIAPDEFVCYAAV